MLCKETCFSFDLLKTWSRSRDADVWVICLFLYLKQYDTSMNLFHETSAIWWWAMKSDSLGSYLPSDERFRGCGARCSSWVSPILPPAAPLCLPTRETESQGSDLFCYELVAPNCIKCIMSGNLYVPMPSNITPGLPWQLHASWKAYEWVLSLLVF